MLTPQTLFSPLPHKQMFSRLSEIKLSAATCFLQFFLGKEILPLPTQKRKTNDPNFNVYKIKKRPVPDKERKTSDKMLY